MSSKSIDDPAGNMVRNDVNYLCFGANLAGLACLTDNFDENGVAMSQFGKNSNEIMLRG